MNREIKFRAWHEDSKQMVYFGLGENHFKICDKEGNDWTLDLYYKPPVMQFTGLKDMHGTPIYEGDKVDNGHEEFVVTFGKQEYIDIDPAFGLTYVGFSPQLLEYEGSELEIIGNIYEQGGD